MNNTNYYFRFRKNKLFKRYVRRIDSENWVQKSPFDWQINDTFWWAYNLSLKLNIPHKEFAKIFPKLMVGGRKIYWMDHKEFMKISPEFGLQFFEDLQLEISSSFPDEYFQKINLWQFLFDMLNSDKYNPQYIKWIDKKEGSFKLIEGDAIAELWGQRIRHPNMTLKKLSRCIRYNYKSKYFAKQSGKQRAFIYKFGPKFEELLKGIELRKNISPNLYK